MEALFSEMPKQHTEGTHRSRSPAETYAAYAPFMPKLGITRIANVTGLDWIGMPVFNAIRPNSRSLSVAQGKGVDPMAAKVSALMESIEYWHGEHIDNPLIFDSYNGLRQRKPVVDVTKLPLRAGLDGIGAAARETPARAKLQLDVPMPWIEGYDIVKRAPVWVPFETARLNKVGLDYAQTTFRVASCGLASGNNLTEATIHAMCELVERDSLTLWWSDQEPDVPGTKVIPSTIPDLSCQRMLEQFEKAGIDVAIWDVTSDVGVPSYQVCVIEKEERAFWRNFGPCWGYGTHLSPTIALSRALTEAAQSRITVIAASRDDNFRGQYLAQNDPKKLKATREVLFGTVAKKDFLTRETKATPSFNGDLESILGAVRSVGIESVVVINLTKPELNIPVVKVIIPGLEFYSLFIGYEPGQRARAKLKGATR